MTCRTKCNCLLIMLFLTSSLRVLRWCQRTIFDQCSHHVVIRCPSTVVFTYIFMTTIDIINITIAFVIRMVCFDLCLSQKYCIAFVMRLVCMCCISVTVVLFIHICATLISYRTECLVFLHFCTSLLRCKCLLIFGSKLSNSSTIITINSN